MLTSVDMLARRIRIRSWKDLVAILVTGVVYGGLLFLLPRIFPTLSEKAVKIISTIAAIIVCVLMLFGLQA